MVYFFYKFWILAYEIFRGMWFWHNTQLITDKELILDISNRAFHYGDGIFETMIIKDGKMLYSEYHEKRIKMGIEKLRLNFILTIDEIEKRLSFLLQKNGLTSARAKMIIWRKPGGLYRPSTNDTEYIISIKELEEKIVPEKHLELCETIRIPMGIAQNCKTLNSLPYVLAGVELNERNDADDLLILDCNENICECISSNIFWIKDDVFYTPSLKTNCVAGVQRNYLIDKIRKKGYKIEEVEAPWSVLEDADKAFTTNVTGIYPLKSFRKKSFSTFDPEKFRIDILN